MMALIPARGGSKGLFRKNILPVFGLPLISWTINAAKKSKYVDDVFVTTDDPEIAAVSRRFGATVIARPECLAQDDTSSEPVIKHALLWMKSNNIECQDIVFLQPTSPLRDESHIDAAVDIYRNKGAKAVISVYEPEHTPIKSYILEESGELTGLYSNDAPYLRRQDLPKAFQPNGAIYVFSLKSFFEEEKIPRTCVYPYEMLVSESIDIDSQSDLDLAERLLKGKYNEL